MLSANLLAAAPAGNSRCFPLEELRTDLYEIGLTMLQELLETKALYTWGGVKPLSIISEDSQTRFLVNWNKYLKTLSESDFRLILEKFVCDDFQVKISIFYQKRNPISGRIFFNQDPLDQISPNKKYFQLSVYRKKEIERVIRENLDLFELFSITPETEVSKIETKLRATIMHGHQSAKAKAHIAKGLLLGYPRYAVELFANQNHSINHYVFLPVVNPKAPTFYWYTSSNHQLNSEDRAVLQAGMPIFSNHQKFHSFHKLRSKESFERQFLTFLRTSAPKTCQADLM